MNNKTAIWAGVAIVGIVTASVTFLAAIKADTNVVLTIVATVVVPLIGFLGYGELKANRQATENVQRQTNGSYTQVLDMMRQQAERQDHIMRALMDIKAPLSITEGPTSVDATTPK